MSFRKYKKTLLQKLLLRRSKLLYFPVRSMESDQYPSGITGQVHLIMLNWTNSA